MGEFTATLQSRMQEASAAMSAALAAGDTELTQTHSDEIEHLRWIAASHGIPEPAL